jgi:hypothetical protein
VTGYSELGDGFIPNLRTADHPAIEACYTAPPSRDWNRRKRKHLSEMLPKLTPLPQFRLNVCSHRLEHDQEEWPIECSNRRFHAQSKILEGILEGLLEES